VSEMKILLMVSSQPGDQSWFFVKGRDAVCSRRVGPASFDKTGMIWFIRGSVAWIDGPSRLFFKPMLQYLLRVSKGSGNESSGLIDGK